MEMEEFFGQPARGSTYVCCSCGQVVEQANMFTHSPQPPLSFYMPTCPAQALTRLTRSPVAEEYPEFFFGHPDFDPKTRAVTIPVRTS